MDFLGKTDSIILLGFECTINPQNLIKIVRVIFEKIVVFIFFLMWTTVNFRVRGKIKNKRPWIFAEDPRYRISMISVNCFRCNVRRLSQRLTFFLNTFLKWEIDIEWKSINNNRSQNFLRLQYFLCSWQRSKVKIKMLKSNFRRFESILKIPPRR